MSVSFPGQGQIAFSPARGPSSKDSSSARRGRVLQPRNWAMEGQGTAPPGEPLPARHGDATIHALRDAYETRRDRAGGPDKARSEWGSGQLGVTQIQVRGKQCSVYVV